MILFAALLDRLARAPHAAARAVWLAHYRARVPAAEAAEAQTLLEGRLVLPRLGLGVLRGWVATRCDAAEFALGRAAGGELTETLALLWPAGPPDPPTLETVVEGAGDWAGQLPGWLDRSDAAVRLALLRLARGRLPRLQPLGTEAAPVAGRVQAMLTYVVREGGGLRLGFGLARVGDFPGAGRAEAAPAVLEAALAWMRAHGVRRFGPVTEVAPGLVLVVEYARLEASRRTAAGLVLRGARAVALGQVADPLEVLGTVPPAVGEAAFHQ
jgi:hypothetical protein